MSRFERGIQARTAETVGVHPSTISRRLAKGDTVVGRIAINQQYGRQNTELLHQLNKGQSNDLGRTDGNG